MLGLLTAMAPGITHPSLVSLLRFGRQSSSVNDILYYNNTCALLWAKSYASIVYILLIVG